jgi:hypothetical protein
MYSKDKGYKFTLIEIGVSSVNVKHSEDYQYDDPNEVENHNE